MDHFPAIPFLSEDYLAAFNLICLSSGTFLTICTCVLTPLSIKATFSHHLFLLLLSNLNSVLSIHKRLLSGLITLVSRHDLTDFNTDLLIKSSSLS